MGGSEFCYLHNPAISDEVKKFAQIKGGETRRVAMNGPLPKIRLKKPKDAVLLLADTIHRVRSGEMDVRIANSIGVLSGHLIKAFEIAQLGDRVEYIERLVLEKRETRRIGDTPAR